MPYAVMDYGEPDYCIYTYIRKIGMFIACTTCREEVYMAVESEVEELEDEILNPLNGILSLAYSTHEYKNIYAEIERLVEVLEKRGLIHPRKIVTR